MVCVMVLSLAACGQNGNTVVQDDSPVTMLINLGNSESYYRALAEKITENLGIEVEFVYQICYNSSDMSRLYFKNNDLPADIVFTASKTDDELLKDSCVDILSYSSVSSLFTAKTVEECTTENGAIYQLPVSSKLIGITYNETLLNEMGWDVPENYSDMLDLKAKCDAAGIKFAVTDGVATGHGFNLLFHLMGVQWLSTPDGTEWFEGFLEGTKSIDEFSEHCEYFKKWTEAGLWGSFHTQDWGGSTEFSQTRALFWFSILNSSTGYDGPEYDDNGNATGRELHDTYKTIPWISENGDNNCYTYYDNCWVYVNKDLEAADKSDKLQKVFKIIEYMCSDEITQLVSESGKDTYVAVNSYDIGDDRLYSAYNEKIKTGFVQPWYYNYFDTDSIVGTGEVINAYIAGTGSFENIFTVLNTNNQNRLNAETDALAEFPDGLGYEDTAKLVALAAATALDMTLEANGKSERVEVTIAPYTPGPNLLPPWKSASVCNSVVYKGKLETGAANTVLAQSTQNPVGIYMTGAEIKALIANKFDPSDRFIDKETGESTFDSEHYGPYPYVCLVKGNAELEDNREYLVALCDRYITLAEYTAFTEAGKVISGLDGTCTLMQGLTEFASAHPTITAADLCW